MNKICNTVDLNNFCSTHGYIVNNIDDLIKSEEELTTSDILPHVSIAPPDIWYILTGNDEIEDSFSRPILKLFTQKDALIALNLNDTPAPIGYIYGTDLLDSNPDFYEGTFKQYVTDEYSLNILIKDYALTEDVLADIQTDSPNLLLLLHDELTTVINTIICYVRENHK